MRQNIAKKFFMKIKTDFNLLKHFNFIKIDNNRYIVVDLNILISIKLHIEINIF